MELETEKINQEYEDFKETVDKINDAANEMNSYAQKSDQKTEGSSAQETGAAPDHKKYPDEETKEKEILQYNEHEVERVKKMEGGEIVAETAAPSHSTCEDTSENDDQIFYTPISEE